VDSFWVLRATSYTHKVLDTELHTHPSSWTTGTLNDGMWTRDRYTLFRKESGRFSEDSTAYEYNGVVIETFPFFTQ
jgi:hypothetical protein